LPPDASSPAKDPRPSDDTGSRSPFHGGPAMIRRTLGCLVVAVSVTGGVALQAHHSLAGVYDMNGEKELVGKIVKILFVNPHGSLTPAVQHTEGRSHRV